MSAVALVLSARLILEGFMAFAAIHYAFQWWWSKRERVLLAFAVFAALLALLNQITAMVSSATTVEDAQFWLNARTTVGVLPYPLLAWIVARVAKVDARRFILVV